MRRPFDSVLSRFTRDLTAEARLGRLEPVRAREAEIARVIDILLRQGKNNPALVGPAGVGKTAIAEGLAQRLAAGDAPLALRDVRVLSLDHVALLAGTTYRGQYESRIEGLVAEVTAAGDVVLFVDELHNLIGQGTALGSAMDAANMLKPALVRGDFRVIGATTDDEYARWIAGDPALERRFQKVTVRELGVAETDEILRARRLGLERHHGVVIGEDALLAARRLTDEHVTDRLRPDRAIDALDEACAHTHAEARYRPETAALLLERRALLREGALDEARGDAPATDDAAAQTGTASAEAADGDAPSGEDRADRQERDDWDPLVDLARDGFAALERFGAELEAVLAPGAEGARPRRASTPESRPRRAARPAGRRLAELDVEIARRLADEGVVVRAHDVARVVAVATGRSVTWSE
jgi:ATP-dependent Clp protease ATP-binding subunit ClpA